jgi:hypothetical protein
MQNGIGGKRLAYHNVPQIHSEKILYKEIKNGRKLRLNQRGPIAYIW